MGGLLCANVVASAQIVGALPRQITTLPDWFNSANFVRLNFKGECHDEKSWSVPYYHPIITADSQVISHAIFYPLLSKVALLWVLILGGLVVGGTALLAPAMPTIGSESLLQAIYQKLAFSVDANVQASRSAFPLAYSLRNHLAIGLGIFSGVLAGFVPGDLSAYRRSVSNKSSLKRGLAVLFLLMLVLAPVWLEMTPNKLQWSFYVLEQIKNDRLALFIWVETWFFTNFCVIFYCLLEVSSLFKGARHAS